MVMGILASGDRWGMPPRGVGFPPAGPYHPRGALGEFYFCWYLLLNLTWSFEALSYGGKYASFDSNTHLVVSPLRAAE